MLQAAEAGSVEAQKILDDVPELPDSLSYLWSWFNDISRGRGSGGFGIPQLSWQDIHLWEVRRGCKLDWWEVDTILELDAIYVQVLMMKEKKQG